MKRLRSGGSAVDDAMARFALAYAGLTDQDHDALTRTSGRRRPEQQNINAPGAYPDGNLLIQYTSPGGGPAPQD
jgi:hypothetical protein